MRSAINPLVIDLDAAARHADGSTSRGAGEVPRNLNQGGGDVDAANAMSSGSGVASLGALPADVHDSIQTLVPYGDSDEEVALPEDDVALQNQVHPETLVEDWVQVQLLLLLQTGLQPTKHTRDS